VNVAKQTAVEGNFLEVKCPDCSNTQIVFGKCATKVPCQACGSTLALPTGGKSEIKGEIVRVVE
jgi:small subunit ribosomal protein S27e